MGQGAVPATQGLSLLPGWLFLPARILQGDSAASYKHSCYRDAAVSGEELLHFIT